MDKIGTLTEVDIRTVWEDEAKDFTPWLAENADLLGEALGVSLEHVETEASVGPYRADLVFKDATEQVVVVENMLDDTDHKHLGQVITYAAGLGAAYAVLIAPKFRDEHRSALTWLNSISKNVAFFGVALEAWRIDNSPPAPRLRVEVKPDHTTQDGTWSDLKSLQYEFWGKLLPELGNWHTRTPQAANSLHFGIGRTGFDVWAYFTSGQLRAALKIKFYSDAERTKAAFEHLREKQDQIEKGLGGSAEWDELDRYGACWIWLSYPEPMEVSEQEKWAQAQAWLVDKVNRLRQTIRPLIEELPR